VRHEACPLRSAPVASNAKPGGGRASGMLVTDQIDGQGEDHLGAHPRPFLESWFS
jgi:hypothetical protein